MLLAIKKFCLNIDDSRFNFHSLGLLLLFCSLSIYDFCFFYIEKEIKLYS